MVGTSLPRRRFLALSLATLSQAGMTFVHQGIVVVGIYFVAAYHLTLAEMGLVVSFVSIGWMISGIFTGLLIDRFGPRRVLFAGTLLMSSASIAIGFADDLRLICLLMGIIGLGVSSVSLAGIMTVMTTWSRAERGLPMGIRQMGVPAGSMIAAFILPTIVAHYGLHLLFILFGGEIFVLGLGFSFILPGPASTTLPRPRPSQPLWRDLRRIVVPCSAGFLLAWGQYMLLTFTIPMLHARGIAIALAGVALAIAQIGGGIARISLGHLADRLNGRLDLVLIGTAGTATVLALLVAILPTQLPFVFLLGLWFCLGAVMVGWNALIVTWSGERAQSGNTAAAMGFTTSCVLLGATITAPAIGFVIQVSGSYAIAWYLLAVILGGATVILWNGSRRQAQRSAEVG